MTRPRVSLLVANPTARTGRAQKTIDRALSCMREAGLHPEFFPTMPEGATVAALAQRLEKEDVARVVYLGGDGTFNESAKGIILARERTGIDTPLGMLPMGTANNQGRSFGILAGEKALARNVEIIREGTEMWLDVGRVQALDANGEVFAQDLWFDSTGFGLSARILAQRNKDVRRVAALPIIRNFYRDKILYVGSSLNTFVRSIAGRVRFSCEATVDGVVHEFTNVTDVVINGTLLYGGDWIFAPEGIADDGLFELVIFRGYGDWASATIRSHKRNPVTDDDREQVGLPVRSVWPGKTFEMRLFRPENVESIPAQLDGEEFVAADHYRVENLFHHLRILVPEDRHWV